MKNKGKGMILGIILIILDQVTKYLAVCSLKGKDDFILIPGILQFHYLENQSAAFSIDPVSIFQSIFKLDYFTQNPSAFLQAKMIFFIVLTLIVVIVLFLIYLRIPEEGHFLALNLILVFFMAGAIGNLIDRFAHQYVVDFIYFSLINFPVFNVADIYVTCSAAMLFVVLVFYYKEEDLERIFPGKVLKNQ